MSIQSENNSQYAHTVLVAKMLIAQTDNAEAKTLTTSPEGKGNTRFTQAKSIENKTLNSSAEEKHNVVTTQTPNVKTKTLTSSPEGKGNTREVDCPQHDFKFTLHFSASNTSNPDPQASGKGKWSSFWEVLSALCLAPMKDDNVM